MKLKATCAAGVCLVLAAIGRLPAQQPPQAPKYDLLLKGGHVIDPRNNRDGVMDVAVAAGKIAAVAPNINPAVNMAQQLQQFG